MDVDAILRRRPPSAWSMNSRTRTRPGLSAKSATKMSGAARAGINVVSTLNVQHLESLNDVVESITGVSVRETMPDSRRRSTRTRSSSSTSRPRPRARAWSTATSTRRSRRAPRCRASSAPRTSLRCARSHSAAQRRRSTTSSTAYMREVARRRTDVDEHVLVLVDEHRSRERSIRRAWRHRAGHARRPGSDVHATRSRCAGAAGSSRGRWSWRRI